jgi:hypothetical protein
MAPAGSVPYAATCSGPFNGTSTPVVSPSASQRDPRRYRTPSHAARYAPGEGGRDDRMGPQVLQLQRHVLPHQRGNHRCLSPTNSLPSPVPRCAPAPAATRPGRSLAYYPSPRSTSTHPLAHYFAACAGADRCCALARNRVPGGIRPLDPSSREKRNTSVRCAEPFHSVPTAPQSLSAALVPAMWDPSKWRA